MICPRCNCDNVPGADLCAGCLLDLAPLEQPVGLDRVQETLLKTPVNTLQPRPPVVMPDTGSLGQAVKAMLTHGVGTVLVADRGGQLVGIFSERDLLAKVAGIYGEFENLPVRSFMTPRPETVTGDDPLAVALQKMDLGGYRHLPVVQMGRPVGMISVRDLMRTITRMCREERG